MTTAQPTLTVAGTGSARAVPDTAALELGVETRGSTPAQAWRAAAAPSTRSWRPSTPRGSSRPAAPAAAVAVTWALRPGG